MDLGDFSTVKHDIDTKDALPVKQTLLAFKAEEIKAF